MDAILACAASASPEFVEIAETKAKKKLFFTPALTFSQLLDWKRLLRRQTQYEKHK